MIRHTRNKTLLVFGSLSAGRRAWCLLAICGLAQGILPGGALRAQSFENKAYLATVPVSGFYSVEITPDLSRYVQTDFRDLRILDEQDRQIPYILEKADSNGGAYLENPIVLFHQKDSNDQVTYCTIRNPEGYHISKVSIAIKGPVFYKRKMEICIPGRGVIRESLSSDTAGVFSLPSFRDPLWKIKIYNRDNLPLTILSLSTFQQAGSVICYLEATGHYHLLMNNERAEAPVYDLPDFKGRIPSGIPVVKVTGFSKNFDRERIVAGKKEWITQNWLWPTLLLILAVLLVFTWRLTREVGKNER